MTVQADGPVPVVERLREDELPAELLAQLSAIPEEAPGDFVCVICQQERSNRWNHSPRDYERPPICKSCEVFKGWYYNGARNRTPPNGSTFRDRRNALRIDALADTLADEAARKKWETRHGCA